MWKHQPPIDASWPPKAISLITALQEAGLPEPVWDLEPTAITVIPYGHGQTWLDIGALRDITLSDLLAVLAHAQIVPSHVMLIGWDTGLRILIQLSSESDHYSA